MAVLSERTLPSAPCSFKKRTLTFATSLTLLSTILASTHPPFQLHGPLAVLVHARHVVATGPLHWLLPWSGTLFLRCLHDSCSPFLQVSAQVAPDQSISEALFVNPYKIPASPPYSIYPLPLVFLYYWSPSDILYIYWFICLFLSSPSKGKLCEGRNYVFFFFTALKCQMHSRCSVNICWMECGSG